MIKNPVILKKEIEIIVSPQAQTVLSATKYSLEEFVDWAVNVRRISYGGHDVVSFIEAMDRKQ